MYAGYTVKMQVIKKELTIKAIASICVASN